MANSELNQLRAENAYLKAKIKHLYAEMIEIARYTVPIDAMPKDRTQEVSYAKNFIR